MSGETINEQSSRLMVDGAFVSRGLAGCRYRPQKFKQKAAAYTVHTSLIRIFNCLSFSNFTLNTY